MLRSAIAKNTAYNLAGSIAPMLLGLLLIPRIVHTLGTDRFGILTLTWVVMGYFSLFDLGLGRALTQIVAERTSKAEIEELPDLIWTALVAMLGLGILGGACLALAVPWVIQALKLPVQLHAEARAAFYLMAISVPAAILMTGFQGVLEARHKFFHINLIRVAMGALTFAGPWAVTFRTNHLFWVVLSLEGMRYLALVSYFLLYQRLVPEARLPKRLNLSKWKALFAFGGWMTVSNLIGPLMVNLDRFLIGGIISTSAIAYYATPFDMIFKVFVLSGAFASVLFPPFGASYRVDLGQTRKLYRKGLAVMLGALAPLLLCIAAAAHPLLQVWLGTDFATHSSPVLSVLCLGMLAAGLATVPYALIQGMARPDITAKFHLIELPFYLAALWFLTSRHGIVGTAWAWDLRVAADLILLMIVARIKLKAPIPGTPQEA